MKKLLLFSVILLLFSCSDESKEKIFEVKKTLTAEKIHVKEIFFPEFMTLKDGALVISSSRSNPMIYFYDTPDLNFLGSYGTKGEGDDDFFAFPMLYNSNTSGLYVWGYTPVTFKKLNIKHFPITATKTIKLDKYKSYNNVYIKDDKFFSYYDVSDLAVYKLELPKCEVVSSIAKEKEETSNQFFYSNTGRISTNGKYLIWAYAFQDKIDIYDYDSFSLIKTISGEGPVNIIPNDYENTAFYYRAVEAKEKYFYVASTVKKGSVKENIVQVYDYNGKPIIEYSFDIFPVKFTVDEKNGYIYGYNSNEEDYFLRYKM